jgi:hypothetical protein
MVKLAKLVNTLVSIVDVSWIQYFSLTSSKSRSTNNENNHKRETFITFMNSWNENDFNDPEYGQACLKHVVSFNKAQKQICPSYATYKITKKAGRKYNYDFDISYTDSTNQVIQTSKIEFKFNANTIESLPQFVSPMNPSKYLSQSFEEDWYNKYLVSLLHRYNLPVSDFDTYLKQIHGNEPECMKDAQLLYYQGCKKSSKYTKNPEFYNECIRLSKECITNFISNTELNIELLTEYLVDSQKEKIYLLYKDEEYQVQYMNPDDYTIVSYVKDPQGSRYMATTKSNKQIRILLRWKNGNGIAYPAFQISANKKIKTSK